MWSRTHGMGPWSQRAREPRRARVRAHPDSAFPVDGQSPRRSASRAVMRRSWRGARYPMTKPTRAPETAPGRALTNHPTTAPTSTMATTCAASGRPSCADSSRRRWSRPRHTAAMARRRAARAAARALVLARGAWAHREVHVRRPRVPRRRRISPSPRTHLGGLLLRVDPDESGDLVDGGDIDLFEMRGRRMRGWLQVAPAAVADARGPRGVARTPGVRYARSLPPEVLMTIDEVTELATRPRRSARRTERDAPAGLTALRGHGSAAPSRSLPCRHRLARVAGVNIPEDVARRVHHPQPLGPGPRRLVESAAGCINSAGSSRRARAIAAGRRGSYQSVAYDGAGVPPRGRARHRH